MSQLHLSSAFTWLSDHSEYSWPFNDADFGIKLYIKQGKSEGFDAATGLVILLKFYPNHRFFSPCDLEIWRMGQINPAGFQSPMCMFHVYVIVEIKYFWLWLWMTSKNNRASLLYYIKLCALSQIHRWIQTAVTVRKRSIQVKIGDFLSRVTLELDDDLRKKQGTSSILHQALCIILKP